jgi:hypothetical protein
LSTIQHTVAMQEILCQLTLLYPEYAIGYQPNSNNFSAPSFSSATSPSSSSLESSSAYSYVCDQFVANAPCAGDTFSWHHDCDPCSFHPQCPWVKTHGEYVNHEVGKPLFVTMLLYLDRWWPLHFDAETLFLDPDSDCGVFVRPKAYRIVLMDQDIMHRLSPPSIHAQRPRYSVAVKLVFMSKGAQQKRLTLEKEEFGVPTMFGSTNPSFRGLLSLPKTSVSQVALARTDRKRSRTSALSDA